MALWYRLYIILRASAAELGAVIADAGLYNGLGYAGPWLQLGVSMLSAGRQVGIWEGLFYRLVDW